MDHKQSHIIQKQIIELHIDSSLDAMALQESMSQLANSNLIHIMDRIFSQYCPPHQHIIIDQLRIDMGHLSVKQFEPQFLDQFTAVLKERLEKELASHLYPASNGQLPELSQESSSLSPNERLFEAWIFFLKEGYFPWWFSRDVHLTSWDQMAKDFFIGPHLLLLLQTLMSYPHARTRMALALTSSQLKKEVISMLFPFLQLRQWDLFLPLAKGLSQSVALTSSIGTSSSHRPTLLLLSTLLQIRKAYEGKSISDQQLLIEILLYTLDHLPTEGDSSAPLAKFIEQYMIDFELVSEHEGVDNQTDALSHWHEILKNKKEDAQANTSAEILNRQLLPKEERGAVQEIYLDHAGLVLITPFLTHFFMELGLVEEKMFVNDRARNKGVLLLDYVVSGQLQRHESMMVLSKILCGVELDVPIETDLVIHEADKEECEELLKAVISAWDALKNSSVEALRENFLLRMGKLSMRDQRWRLSVNRETKDILISRIPWTISIVKLPWMKGMLTVDWI